MMASMTGTVPALADDADLHVPAEWTPHERTFMQWPASLDTYEDAAFLDWVQQTIAEIANTISEFEPVTLLMDARHIPGARRLVSERVEIWDIPTEDLWCRDSGPLFAVRNKKDLVVSHIAFNGWGNRQGHRHDAKVAERIAKLLGMDVVPSGVVGEAGGVDHDGDRLLIAHESSWVHNNRNPGLQRDEIGARLLKAYGADTIIWAPGVRDMDITDYHIDGLARFTAPNRILITLPRSPDPWDPFHRAAAETHDRLIAASVNVDVIHDPIRPRMTEEDFVASYANFYICNGAVIAPEFGDRDFDEAAAAALRTHFPGREIVTLNVDALGLTGGGIHCATQQMPRL